MTLHNPTILQEGVGSLVVSEINTFTSILNDITSTRICRRTIPNKLLQIYDIIGRDWEKNTVMASIDL